jgi:hypothetical protein
LSGQALELLDLTLVKLEPSNALKLTRYFGLRSLAVRRLQFPDAAPASPGTW